MGVEWTVTEPTASETRDFWIQGERAEFGGEFVMTAAQGMEALADFAQGSHVGHLGDPGAWTRL